MDAGRGKIASVILVVLLLLGMLSFATYGEWTAPASANAEEDRASWRARCDAAGFSAEQCEFLSHNAAWKRPGMWKP